MCVDVFVSVTRWMDDIVSCVGVTCSGLIEADDDDDDDDVSVANVLRVYFMFVPCFFWSQ